MIVELNGERFDLPDDQLEAAKQEFPELQTIQDKSLKGLFKTKQKEAVENLKSKFFGQLTPEKISRGPLLNILELARPALATHPLFTGTQALRQRTETLPEELAQKQIPGAVPLGVGARIATELLPTGSPEELAFQAVGGKAAMAAKPFLAGLGKKFPKVVSTITRVIANFTGSNENMLKERLISSIDPVKKELTDPSVLDDFFVDFTEGIKQAYDDLGAKVGEAAKRVQAKSEGVLVFDVNKLRQRAIKLFTDPSGKKEYPLNAVLDALTPEKTFFQKTYEQLTPIAKNIASKNYKVLTGTERNILNSELYNLGFRSPQRIEKFIIEHKKADFLSVLEAKRKLYRMVNFGIRDSSGIEAPIRETFIVKKIKDFANALKTDTEQIGESLLGTSEFKKVNTQFNNFAKAAGEYAKIFGRKGEDFSAKFSRYLKRGGKAETRLTKTLTDLEKYGNIGPLSLKMRQAAISQELNQPIRLLPQTGYGFGALVGGAVGGAKLAGLPGAIAGFGASTALHSPKIMSTLGREAIQQQGLQRLLDLLQKPSARVAGRLAYLESQREQ